MICSRNFKILVRRYGSRGSHHVSRSKNITAPSGQRSNTQKFLMKGPDGTSVSFVIPSHVRPGESFMVDVPIASLHSKDSKIKRQIREKIESLEREASPDFLDSKKMIDNDAIKQQVQNKLKLLNENGVMNARNTKSKVLISLKSEIEAGVQALEETKIMIEEQSRNLKDLIEKAEMLTSTNKSMEEKVVRLFPASPSSSSSPPSLLPSSSSVSTSEKSLIQSHPPNELDVARLLDSPSPPAPRIDSSLHCERVLYVHIKSNSTHSDIQNSFISLGRWNEFIYLNLFPPRDEKMIAALPTLPWHLKSQLEMHS